MRFGWDIYKAIGNVAKHHVGFIEASTVFDDSASIIMESFVDRSTGEQRYQIIGEADPDAQGNFRILAVAYTIRDGGATCRIVNARVARRVERKLYEIQKGS